MYTEAALAPAEYTDSPAADDAATVDLACIGFGPAGIGLAAAFSDWRDAQPKGTVVPTIQFVERRPGPAWQPGLLIRGADLNHHFLRDFATPRDPRSRFTFACYLKESGRLFQFGHLGGRVSRVEWNDYVIWAARQLQPMVRYGLAVRSIAPVAIRSGAPKLLKLELGDGSRITARNLVVSTGQLPSVPELFRPHLGPRMFHSAEFLDRIASFDPAAPLNICVLGSGQSAGEMLLWLYDHFPNARLTSVHRGLPFRLVDIGHFSNEVFFPEQVPYFHALSPEKRQRATQEYHLTNFSAVDVDISQGLYWRMYEDRVLGTTRAEVIARHTATRIDSDGEGFRIHFRDGLCETERTVNADIVVLGTGYYEPAFPPLLEPLRQWIVTDPSGGPEVALDYRVRTTPDFGPELYLNGVTERTHGASDASSLSMTALKAQTILESFLAAHHR
ncbi:SidA/IucD/PvdA family monooxygenase [Sphingomonas sp. 37zxx]|uniref:SidA/IucD/PvdA family monooxygenase n=1 Tax=Sphingomonas sp. 37zxx TaxID=1550073 RepID=UPI00068D7688|nr:SidA/IucD/PvdA family monooxygenase [Sphingomonas sp. 37zxx]